MEDQERIIKAEHSYEEVIAVVVEHNKGKGRSQLILNLPSRMVSMMNLKKGTRVGLGYPCSLESMECILLIPLNGKKEGA